jgi:TonB family protein
MKRTVRMLTHGGSTECWAAYFVFAMCLSADSVSSLSQARAAMNRGELVNAEQLLNASIQEIEAKSGPNASALDSPLELLAQVYRRGKRFHDAAAMEQRRLDIWTSKFGENAVIVARVLGQMSAAEKQAGNLPDAESHARRALAILTAEYTNKPASAEAAVDMADVLLAENREDEAGQMLALAEKTFETSLGPGSLLTKGVAARRAVVLKQPAPPPSTSSAYRVGGEVTVPRILSKAEPVYSEEARKNKLQGSVVLSVVVDASGAPTQIAVLRPLGMGLDEAAIAAVSQWKFSPGTKNGTAVPVFTQIEMTFHLL